LFLSKKAELFEGLKVGESEFLQKNFGVGFNPITSLKSLGKKLVGKGDDIIKLDLNDEKSDTK
jgi:hypothetical protein